ncbi:unnamed protein product [Meloidogyne enterolobii]|uniref:Uncharacterized protein n=2 Tax=Meloidogyne enterolobii TaxID=390850 RepID=A0ACB0XM53_MELEN|nr:unnamed protein product [Meloidogyne enterolobii]
MSTNHYFHNSFSNNNLGQNHFSTIFERITVDSNNGNHRMNAEVLDKTIALMNVTSQKLKHAVFETSKLMIGEDARGIAKTNPEENNKGGQQKTSLFKTEMCYNFQRSGGQCKYGNGCWFAHTLDELRPVPSHLPATPKFAQLNGNWF